MFHLPLCHIFTVIPLRTKDQTRICVRTWPAFTLNPPKSHYLELSCTQLIRIGMTIYIYLHVLRHTLSLFQPFFLTLCLSLDRFGIQRWRTCLCPSNTQFLLCGQDSMWYRVSLRRTGSVQIFPVSSQPRLAFESAVPWRSAQRCHSGGSPADQSIAQASWGEVYRMGCLIFKS